MAIGEKLYTRLSQYAGLRTLVATRIYPVVIPQGTQYPAVTYEVDTAERFSCFGSDTGVVRQIYRITAYSENYSITKTVATQIQAALQRWRDETTSNVFDTFLEDTVDDYDWEQNCHMTTLDFTVFYKE